MYAQNSVFFGKLNDTNPNELLKKIDYTKSTAEDRKQVIKGLVDTGFYDEYFAHHFKVNINSGDSLSEFDNACSSLEKMANYLLNSDEVKESKKETDYVFYTDEESFRKAINKEPKLEGMGSGVDQDNIIHFLKKENRNYKKSKNQSIQSKDINRDDFLGEVLQGYNSYLASVTKELNEHKESKLTRYKLSEISGSVKQDMITSKDSILGVFGYKTNAEESTVIDWYLADLRKPDVARALLYMKPGHRSDENLQYLIDDFVEKMFKAKPTKLQKEIILLMRSNKGPTEIGEILGISKQRVVKNVDMIVYRVCKIARQEKHYESN